MAATGLLLAAACGGSGFTYVSNSGDGAYFKVPDDWTVYDEGDVLKAGNGVSDEQVEALKERVWLRGFDASDEPSPEHVISRVTDHPRGYAEVRQLDARERGTADLVALRSVGFPPDMLTGLPTDPVAAFEADPSGPIQLLRYDDDLVFDDGSRGIRIAIVLRGDGTSVVEQIAVLDPATTRRYVFSIGCSLDCWEENEDLIAEVLDSWTIREES
jgi:hypothetical protein